MLKSSDASLIEKLIHYQFKDPGLLELALSHRSVGQKNNERLEFLGDAVLGQIVSEFLYHKFPKLKEGELSRLRSHLVRGDTLAELAREMKIQEFVLLGGGELKSGGHRRSSIQADMLEAIVGAIFLDAGMEECRQIVLLWFESRLALLNENMVTKDPKTRLQEYMQEKGKQLPRYSVVDEFGANHAREYKVECKIDGTDEVFIGVANSKREAEKAAAKSALTRLGKQP